MTGAERLSYLSSSCTCKAIANLPFLPHFALHAPRFSTRLWELLCCNPCFVQLRLNSATFFLKLTHTSSHRFCRLPPAALSNHTFFSWPAPRTWTRFPGHLLDSKLVRIGACHSRYAHCVALSTIHSLEWKIRHCIRCAACVLLPTSQIIALASLMRPGSTEHRTKRRKRVCWSQILLSSQTRRPFLDSSKNYIIMTASIWSPTLYLPDQHADKLCTHACTSNCGLSTDKLCGVAFQDCVECRAYHQAHSFSTLDLEHFRSLSRQQLEGS